MGYNSKYSGEQVEELLDSIETKQDELVSGKNIKTINGYSLLGSGNIAISGGGGEIGYSAKISLLTPQFNAVLKDSTGNYIEFTFDTTNGAGDSMGEGVTCTYTITRGTNKTIVTEKYRYNTKVRFNVDKYLQEGANDIVINIVGDISGESALIGVTFQVVDLFLEASYDISTVHDLSNQKSAIIEVPFTVSGYGTKVVEWYLDGVMLGFVKDEDEVVDVLATRTKYITISNLQQGTHSLQLRAYTNVNGELFYSDTMYYDLLVYTGVSQELIMGVAATIPVKYGVLGADEELKIYNAVQYKTYTLRFATYSPTSASSTLVQIFINGEKIGEVSSSNGIENEFRYIPTTFGNKTLKLQASTKEYIIPMVIDKTTMNIDEITTSLVLDFNANGRSNNSSNKDQWEYKGYKATFSGFNWNSTSGWVDGRLEMNAGSSLAIDYAPLSDSATKDGKTIEIEWSTKNVNNDNAVICDLRGENGVGILITATKVSMTSADGVVVETEYKSEENVRVGFVINKASGSTNQRLSFIYANGIVSRGEKWAVNDNYLSDKEILFTATEDVEISLKSIRIYNTALSSDQILNNYTLYRDSVAEMMEVYDRNDIYVDGTTTFSPDKMMNRLPVMIVTGDIPILENTSDKDTQIVVDIEYYNMQKPERSFTMKGAAMRPQGTSSMGYPKKNFRIYTQKVDGTILYDANGNVVEDKLYSFKDGAQPVDCWCLKADYAESSGTHNTGIAKLWNNALMNAQIDGEYVCRTEAQKKALEAGYEYDVRTTIDGFPILLFYRKSEKEDVIFIGKYNFNNDKSTESVFGFTGIPNFDNSKMQCWEVLNNGNALALFTTTEGFDEGWSEAFESRYPDTKTPHTGDLKAFCEWMVNVSQEDFATQKWEHLNIYMMAAYWVYLMRHAAADQFVKNAMFTSEDGQKWYYILYDNDTINGLINTGRLRIQPTDDRQTIDNTGSYVFAGHDSRLWNMLEADEEFKNIVSSIDNALYSAGISYANTIKVFDEEQADKWVEKVYNQDAQYKYVGPYVEKGIDNLFMLQGKRDLHRRWWLAKRFSIYDAKYVSGTYKSQAVELKCINGTPEGQSFKVTSGYPLDYGYGINNVPREFGITLEPGESHTFTTREVVNLGDPIRIYGAPNIAELDLSPMASKLAVVTVANVYDESLGTKLTKLVVGKNGVNNLEVTEISGLKQATSLEYLDIRGMKAITSIDLSSQTKLKTLVATSSGATSFTFAKGAPVEHIALPAGVRTLELTQLPYLHADGVTFEALASLETMNVTSCPNVSNDFSFVWNWYNSKTIADSRTVLTMDNVDWQNVDVEQFMQIANIGNLILKGRVYLNSINLEQMNILMDKFGESAFNEDAEFFIDGPANAFVLGKTELLEGTSETYRVVAFGGKAKSVQFSLYNGSNSYTSVTQEGMLTVREGFGNGTFTMRVIVTTEEDVFYTDVNISVAKRVYPTVSNLVIEGSNSIENEYEEYTLSYPDDVNGEFDTVWTLAVSEEGFVEIESYDDFSCTLKKVQETYVPVYLTLTATLTKKVNGAAVATVSKEIAYINDDIAEYDAGIIAALYAAGLCSSDKYITKDEAAKVTASDLQPGTSESTSIFWRYKDQIKNFNGFQYFTNIIEVPDYCFANSKLESIVLNDKITKIGKAAFNLCYSLKNINMPKSLISLGENALGATLIESIDLPEGLMTLGIKCLWECDYLEEVVVPSTVAEIPTYFCYLSGVKRVVLKEGVQRINENAFQECLHLESLAIPSTVTTINDIFNKCDKVQFNVAESNPNFKSIDGVLYDKDLTKLLLFRKGAITKEHTIPSSISHIGDYGFYRTTIEVVNHGGGLHLGISAFTECPSLRRLNAKVLSFSTSAALNYCFALESVTLADSVTTLPQYAFMQCLSLKAIYSEAVKAPTTGYYAFGVDIRSYTGRNTYDTGENFLYIPLNAQGYETYGSGILNGWVEPLQHADRCGFSIYGQLTINSNRENAQFSVTYTTVDGPLKSVTVGVGTCYLNDVKYNTSMTIVPITTGVGEFDWSTKTFVYSKDNNVVENNAYVFPADATIVGESNPVENGTYTWSTTTQNVDGAYTAEWTLSGEITSQVEIASQDNTKCVMNIIGVPTDFVYGTLTLTLRKANGTVIVTTTKSLAAVIEGVVITSKSNAPIQACLYAAGLVANENYSLQSELEKITANQLQPGTTSETSIFYLKESEIEHFDEFKYFTGVTSINSYTFGGINDYSNFKRIVLPPNLKEIKKRAFYSGGLENIVFNDRLETIGEDAFATCDFTEIVLPASVKGTIDGSFDANMKLKTLDFSKTKVNTITDHRNLNSLVTVKFPSTITKIGRWQFDGSKLRNVHCDAVIAPIAEENGSSAFGKGDQTSGVKKYIYVPTNATGYDDNGWETLTNGGFKFYGMLKLSSNKSSANFNVSYTTTDGTIKTLNFGVGTIYLNDIKYDTQMTITPDAISGYTWSEASKTFVYNDSAQTHTFNAYIYPTAMTIEGTGSLVGGRSATYTAVLTPSNSDAPINYTWSVSGSSNVSITPNGSTCVVSSDIPEENESFTIKCIAKSSDNKVSFEQTMAVTLLTRESYISAVYDVTDTNSKTALLYEKYTLSNVTFMEIDGVQVTPVLSYKFATTGTHTVRYTLSTLSSAFYGADTLVSVDFSETNGKTYTSFDNVFVYCGNLVSVEFGEESFTNVTSLANAFNTCRKLQSLDLSAFNGAPITTMNRMCMYCSALSSIVLPTLNVSNVNCGYFLYESSLVEVDLSPLAGVKGDILFDNSFRGCLKLESLDFTPLAYTPGFYTNTFSGCIKLSTIILPFMEAPIIDSYTFGTSTSSEQNRYTGYSTRGSNVLYVPNGATGYDTGAWLDPLQNASKCGFTISYTL